MTINKREGGTGVKLKHQEPGQIHVEQHRIRITQLSKVLRSPHALRREPQQHPQYERHVNSRMIRCESHMSSLNRASSSWNSTSTQEPPQQELTNAMHSEPCGLMQHLIIIPPNIITMLKSYELLIIEYQLPQTQNKPLNYDQAESDD